MPAILLLTGVVFFDPPCDCYSFYTRWYGAKDMRREVRRARSKNLQTLQIDRTKNYWNVSIGLGHWGNQSVVLQPDALDDATSPVGSKGFLGPMDMYGSSKSCTFSI